MKIFHWYRSWGHSYEEIIVLADNIDEAKAIAMKDGSLLGANETLETEPKVSKVKKGVIYYGVY